MTISSAARALRAALGAALLLAARGDDAGWLAARPDYAWSFPRDHWAHPGYRTEWWYFTGQLADAADSTHRFGYQFTFFRVGITQRPPALGSDWASASLIMGHAAVTDLATGTHRFGEIVYRAVPMLGGFGAAGDPQVAWSRGPAGTDTRWTLAWDDGFTFRAADRRAGLAFDLRTRAERPLVLHGANGFSRKGEGANAASLYYSLTRLATDGTLSVGGRSYDVRGLSWMDKEFGSNQLRDDQVGWDWFSLQLDDGRDLMLYVLRDSTGRASWASGTVVPARGAPRPLDAAAFTVQVTAQWTSDSTRAAYPSRWIITVPGEDLTLDIVPLAADQEDRSGLLHRLFYWEGAVSARAGGREVGRGYVELTGYGRGMRPAI